MKPPATLLIATSQEVARVELTGGGQPRLKQIWRGPRSAGESLVAAIDLAASLGEAGRGRRTVVLAEDVWTGVVDVEARSIQGLERSELVQLLQFETEPLSGVDPLAGRLEFIELAPVVPETRRFWCTSLEASTADALSEQLAARRLRLIALAHPTGLGAPRDAQEWVEFRPGLAAAVSHVAGGRPRVTITATSTTSDRWYRSLEASFESGLPEAGLVHGVEPPAAYSGRTTDLDDEAALRDWLLAVASGLRSTPRTPWLSLAETATPAAALIAAGALAAILALTACGGHWRVGLAEQQTLRRQLEEQKQLAEAKRQLDAELRQLADQEAELGPQRERLLAERTALVELQRLPRRFAQLLRSVAGANLDELVVDQIDPRSEGLRLAGRAISSDSPGEFAVRLAPRVTALGWRVGAPEVEGQQRLANGGPWTFHVDLADLPPGVVEEAPAARVPVTQVSVTQVSGAQVPLEQVATQRFPTALPDPAARVADRK